MTTHSNLLPFKGPASSSSSSGVVSPERLFDGLDGRHVRVASQSWTIEVYSICTADGWRWLQVAVFGAEHYPVTVRLSQRDDARQAVRAIRTWLANPTSANGQVLDVA